MEFGFSVEDNSLRDEVRQFLRTELSSTEIELCQKVAGFLDTITEEPQPIIRTIARKLAGKGWLGLSWPKKYGGQEASPIAELVCVEELAYGRIPLLCTDMGIAGISVIGPALLQWGSEEQKKEHLPAIARGNRFWCLAYSEPNAGSDLASLQCRARTEGNYYIVDGEKCWTSAAQFADWCWLAARTATLARKHEGISILLVDLKSPGVTVQPIPGVGGHSHFNQIFFDKVAVPKHNLVGEENAGWSYLPLALNLERVSQAIRVIGSVRRGIDDLVSYVKEAKKNGTSVSCLIRHWLAEMVIEAEVGRLLVYRAGLVTRNILTFSFEASVAKLYTTELVKKVANVAMQILGLYGQLEESCPLAPLNGLVAGAYLHSPSPPIMGGTSEIERNITARQGLGLPG